MNLEKYNSVWAVLLILLSTFSISFISKGDPEITSEPSVDISQRAEEVLEDDLRERINSEPADERVKAVIRLTPYSSERRSEISDLEKVSSRIVTELKEHSGKKQSEFIDHLNRQGGEVLNTFWIANAVLIEVELGSLKVLAEHEEVWKIHDNFELDIMASRSSDPIEESRSIPRSIPSSEEMTWGLDRIDVKGAWEEGEIWDRGYDGSDVRVAVSDTGVDIEHPDLEGKMVTADEEDVYYPGGWIEFDEEGNVVENSTPRDTHFHGTHVSGTVVGENDSGKHIGVAPGAELMHALTFQEGTGEFVQMMASFEWKVEPHDRFGDPLHEKYGGDIEDYRPDIASMSWSAPGYWSTFEEPIQNLRNSEIVPVAAVGNGGEGTARSPGAIYETFAIGASEEDDDIARFSSGDIVEDERELTPQRYIKPDFAAPGVRIESAVPEQDWRSLSGTSMSTPHVAGTIALMLDADPDLSIDKIYETLDTSSDYHFSGDTLPDGEDKNTRYGHGIINAAKAADSVSGLAIREPEDIGKHTASLRAEVLDMPADEIEVFFRYREVEKDEWTETEPETITEPKRFEARIEGLEENTDYEYKAVAERAVKEERTFSITFSTHRDVEIFTWIPENLTSSSAILKGSVSHMYVEETEIFFRYREESTEGWEETQREIISEAKHFEAEIFDLDYKTTYEYQAVAISAQDEFTGDVIEFTTDLPEPEWDEEERAYLVSNIGELQWMKNEPGRDIILQNDIDASETEGWYYGSGFRPIGDQKGFYSFRGDLYGRGHVISDLYINRPRRDNVGLFSINHNPRDTDRKSKIRNVSLVDADVTGRDNVGALVGWNEGEVIDSHIEGEVQGEENVGGLVGRNGEIDREEDYELEGEVLDSTSAAKVSGEKKVGGLVGWNEAGEIMESDAEGDVIGTGDYVGGLVGESRSVTRSYATGDVFGKGDHVGGLVGLGGNVNSSFSRSEVTGEGNFTGGLGGAIEYRVADSYSTSKVDGIDHVGGLVGMLGVEEYPYGRLQRSYAAGEVQGEKNVGGLIGSDLGFEVSDSFYHEDMPESSVEGYGSLPLSDEEFGSISTFNSAGWDIEMIESDRKFPYLSWEDDKEDVAWLIQETEQTYNLTIHSEEGGKTEPAEGDHTYYEYGKIVVEAVPDEGMVPRGWTGDIETTEPTVTITMTDDMEITALFEETEKNIRNWEHLYEMRYDVEGNFTLENDLDRTSEGYEEYVGTAEGWDPIGELTTDPSERRIFSGSFDGKGHEIRDISTDRTSENYVGLFAIAETALIENVKLVNISVRGKEYVGGLLGRGDMDMFSYGRNEIKNVSVTGEVTGESSVGGAIGHIEDGKIYNSNSQVDVKGAEGHVGGFLGIFHDWFQRGELKVEDTHASGNVTGGGNFVGGLIGGRGSAKFVVENSHATGRVIGEGDYVGGLVGSAIQANIYRSYATGDVEGGGNLTGGLCGLASRGSVNRSYATGDVEGGKKGTGGLLGSNSADLTGVNATGEVMGKEAVGGLIGRNEDGTIYRSYGLGNVTGEGNHVGGLIGKNVDADVEETFAAGDVYGESGYVGGLIGLASGRLSRSYALGDVSGENFVGGLVGKVGDTEYEENSSVSRTYSVGEVHGEDDIGGLIGKISTGRVEDSAWDIERSGQIESDGGTGLTTREMTGERAVENLAGLDFEDIWETVEDMQDDAKADGYCILQSLPREVQLELAYADPPTVITGDARDVTSDSTVLNGELIYLSAVEKVDVYFKYRKYGESDWRETQRQTFLQPQIFNESISNLQADTTYEFRTVAEGYGVAEGKTNTFTTAPLYELMIHVEGEGSTDPEEGTHAYEEGTEISLKATAREGWYFEEWTGDYTGTEDEITITMNEDKEITARFEIYMYDLTIKIEGKGCTEPEEGTHTYKYGEEVIVTATAREGWYFEEWTGDYTGTEDEITITMNEDKEITARFDIYMYDLTIKIEGKGSTEPEEGTHTYKYGEAVTLLAIPEDDWSFLEWTGDHTREDKEITVKIDGEKEITAQFIRDSYFEVEITTPNDEETMDKGNMVIEYTVMNIGHIEDEGMVTLKIRDTENKIVHEAKEEIILGPGKEYEGEFVWNAERSGEFKIEVNTVANEGEPHDSDQINIYIGRVEADGETELWWWAGVIAIAVMLSFISKRRKDGGRERSSRSLPLLKKGEVRPKD